MHFAERDFREKQGNGEEIVIEREITTWVRLVRILERGGWEEITEGKRKVGEGWGRLVVKEGWGKCAGCRGKNEGRGLGKKKRERKLQSSNRLER